MSGREQDGVRRPSAPGPVAVTIGLILALLGVLSPAVGSSPAGASPATDTPAPEAPVLPTPTSLVAAGEVHSCGLFTTAVLACWGAARDAADGDGQLGQGVASGSTTPVLVTRTGTPLAGKSIAQLVVGLHHSCALTSEGVVACWGSNINGQLGTGDSVDSNVPRALAAGSPLAGKTVMQIAAGESHTCALTSEGQVACWGAGYVGQLGLGSYLGSSAPSLVTGGALAGTFVTRIAAGATHTCALTSVGSVGCWGDNLSGQLGHGSGAESTRPVLITTESTPLAGKSVSLLSAGQDQTCALASDQTLACWGEGLLGTGTTGSASTPAAVTRTGTVLAGKTITAISSGGNRGCALASDGTLGCWGQNDRGQVGDGTRTDRTKAVAVTTAGTSLAGRTVSSVSLGGDHSCAATTDGGISCWGDDSSGQMGIGRASYWTKPTAFAPGALAGKAVVALDAAGRSTCALASDGTTACWGDNVGAQLGDGTRIEKASPTALSTSGTPLAGRTITSVIAGGFHACALADGGGPACWGLNFAGEVGNGSSTTAVKPVSVSTTSLGGATFTQLAAGPGLTCGRRSDGAASCWGANDFGQLGTGSSASSASTPQTVVVAGTPLAGKSIAAVAATLSRACALTTDGVAACWGSNPFGELGNGTKTKSSLPVAITKVGTPFEGKALTQVALGLDRTCGLAAGDTLACWGFAGLGNGTSGQSPLPVAVTRTGTPLAGTTIAQLDVGGFACARTTSGSVACWGGNALGELGIGTRGASALVPTALATAGTPLAGKTISQIAVGDQHACALTTDGVVSCWGDNVRGQLGNGVASFSTTAESAIAPPTLPGPPTIGIASRGTGVATVRWSAPSSDGGLPLTGYLVTPYVAGVAQPARAFASVATTQVVTGLTNGTTYTFKVAARNVSGTGPPSAASNAVTPTPPDPPFDSWDAFVARQLLDLTGSAGTVASRAAAVSALTTGTTTPAAYVQGLMDGTWFSGSISPPARLYWAYFGRIPDHSGLIYWAGRYRAGTTLNTISQSFAGSAEFKARYGALSNAGFVNLVYQNVLGRLPDAAGLSYWTQQLDKGTKTRGQVMVGFSESAEYKTKMASSISVLLVYVGMLHRAPSPTELATWKGQSRAALIDAVRLGDEYAALVG